MLSRVVLAVLAVDLLATSGDITLSWTSPVYPKLYSNDSNINPLGRAITENEDAWIGSLLTLGAFIGPMVFWVIVQKFGRKIGLFAIGFPHILSYLTLAFAKDINLFYLARFLGGLAVGGGYYLIPMYITEIAKETDRGTLSQTLTVFWSVGNFIPFAVGPFITIKCFNLILAGIPILFVVVFSVIGTESPLYHVKRNKADKAEKTLMVLRSKEKEEVQAELHEIQAYVKLNQNGSILEIIKDKTTRKYFFICLVLVATEELSGFSSITFHLQLIFEAAETNIPADISAIIVGGTRILSSFISPVLIDRLGRRSLTITSCFGMSTAHTLIGLFFYVQDRALFSVSNITWLPIFSLILYIFSFNFGICCVPWTLVSELFPSNIKEIATLVITSFLFFVSFILTSSFNAMNNIFGRSGTFWFFATACFSTAVFSIMFVPETRGKSFLEIQEMLKFGKINNEAERETIIHKSQIVR